MAEWALVGVLVAMLPVRALAVWAGRKLAERSRPWDERNG